MNFDSSGREGFGKDIKVLWRMHQSFITGQRFNPLSCFILTLVYRSVLHVKLLFLILLKNVLLQAWSRYSTLLCWDWRRLSFAFSKDVESRIEETLNKDIFVDVAWCCRYAVCDIFSQASKIPNLFRFPKAGENNCCYKCVPAVLGYITNISLQRSGDSWSPDKLGVLYHRSWSLRECSPCLSGVTGVTFVVCRPRHGTTPPHRYTPAGT